MITIEDQFVEKSRFFLDIHVSFYRVYLKYLGQSIFPNFHVIYWFTGQPGAGKTTLALALKRELEERGCFVTHFDGDDLRKIMSNCDYSEAGRMKNIKAAQELVAKSHSTGVFIVASFVSPFRDLREKFKEKEDVLEVYVHTKEKRGRESYFVRDYEPPLKNFIDVDTTNISVELCVKQILKGNPSNNSK